MFDSLLRLYSTRVRLEDFTTEILAGVLLSKQSILDSFVNKILNITGSGFSLETQKSYPGSIIDMVFENKEIIIFVENKVNAPEGHEQLSKYAKILCNQDKKHYLRFCTKYIELKNPDAYLPLNKEHFYQFRWLDIYSFLSDYKDEILIKYFLSFMERHDMSRAGEFIVDDLIALRRFPNVMKSVEDSINSATPAFINSFGYVSKYTKAGLMNQLTNKNRYAIWQDEALDGGYSEILLSFNFGDYDYKYPLLNLHVWTSKDHKLHDQIISDLDAHKNELPNISINKGDAGLKFSYEESLSAFISSNSQFEDIKTWFEDKIKILHNYMQNSSLQWNIKNDQ